MSKKVPTKKRSTVWAQKKHATSIPVKAPPPNTDPRLADALGVFREVMALVERFEEASKKFPYFPVYLDMNVPTLDDDGLETTTPFSITFSPGPDVVQAITATVNLETKKVEKVVKRSPIIAGAISKFAELAKDTTPILRKLMINSDLAPFTTHVGRWLWWVFYFARPVHLGAWSRAPVNSTNPEERLQLADNVFFVSASVLTKLGADTLATEVQKVVVDPFHTGEESGRQGTDCYGYVDERRPRPRENFRNNWYTAVYTSWLAELHGLLRVLEIILRDGITRVHRRSS